MKRIFFCVLLISSYLQAQPLASFAKVLGLAGTYEGYSTYQASNNDILVCGSYNNTVSGGKNAIVCRLSDNGSVLWVKEFDFSGNIDIAKCIKELSNGEIIVTGSTATTVGNEDMLFLRLSSAGSILASRKLSLAGSEYGRSIVPVSDFTYIIVGYTSGLGSGANDILLTKIDAHGNVLTCKALGASANDFGESISSMISGSFYIGGYIRDYSSTYDGILIKVDSNLNVSWSKKIGTNSQDDLIASVYGCADGNLLFSGHTKNSGFYDVWFGKVTPTGSILFSKSFGGTSDDYGTNIIEDHVGDIVVKGQTNSFGYGASDVYLIKLNGSGTTYIWSRAYGGSGSESGMSEANSLFESYDGGYVFVCTSTSYSTGSQILTMKSTVSGTNCIVTSQTGTPVDYLVSINSFPLTSVSATPSLSAGYVPLTHIMSDSTLCETTTSIDKIADNQGIMIFPSIIGDNNTLNIYTIYNSGDCKIYSSDGQFVTEFEITNSHMHVDLRLAAGTYLLVYSREKENKTYRFIISP